MTTHMLTVYSLNLLFIFIPYISLFTKISVAEQMLKVGKEIVRSLLLMCEPAVKRTHICQVPDLYLYLKLVNDNLLI